MPDTSTSEPNAIWQRLWEKLVLSAADQQKLREERGFEDEVIEKLGFRSSQAQNRSILESIAQEFPLNDLCRLGIYFKSDDGEYYQNRVFCGWGRTGDYVKNEDGSFKLNRRGKRISERKQGVNPILIPYLNAGGKVETIKPHKDNIPNPDDVDELDEDFTGHHIYCELLLRLVSTNRLYTENHKNFCVITEGEFKAAALFQCGIPALGLPGIHAIRNRPFRRRVVALLKQFGITDVVICFDNEIKDDPAFPNYKPDEWDRVDTIVYARYTAATLYREGIRSTRIANLPDEWRIKGKADWDGSLASFVKEAGDAQRGTATARREFLKILKSAKFEQDCRDLFASTLHRIIEAKLAKLYHVALCPIGGDEERRLGWRIKQLRDIPTALDFSYQIGQGFIDVAGVHYGRKPIKPRGWREEEYTMIVTGRETARAAEDWTLYRYYQELLLGIPKPLSNFSLRCQFKLISADGRLEYLVKVRNIHNERSQGRVRVDAATLSSLKQFREWCLEKVRGTWHGGERDLQALTADMQADSAFREIHEIDTYGHSDQCNLWKFADRAFTPENKEILPDKDLVFWYNGLGYQTDFDKQKIGDGFKQGAPTLGPLDTDSAVKAFILFKDHLYSAVGDFAGWLAFGAILAYAVHPEIFRTYMGVPGIWFVGRGGGGKSTIAEWLIQIWGFNPKINTSLKSGTTYTSIGRELSKYGCLPLPLDEFDAAKTDDRIQGILHNAFTRLADLKATFDGTKRTRGVRPETTPFVLGENSCRNSSTRSRYINISVLETNALGDRSARLKDMNANAHLFPNLGHFIMANRVAFAERVMDELAKWVVDPVIGRFVGPVRQRFISGIPYAAFTATTRMLKEVAKSEADQNDLQECIILETDFRTFAMEHGSESQKEVTDTSFINEFWQDVLNLVQIDPRYRRFFSIKYAEITDDFRIRNTSEFHKEGLLPAMFMAYETIYLIYSQEIRKAGRESRLSIGDLQRELRREKYWIRPKKDESHKMSIQGVGRPVCWVFNLVEHPMGDQFIDSLEQKLEQREAPPPQSEFD